MQSFRPVSIERPKVLLSLANTPMIDYTLAWLARNGVEEVRACVVGCVRVRVCARGCACGGGGGLEGAALL
jgi:NDP-sugar pyrophosphorylase family protein